MEEAWTQVTARALAKVKEACRPAAVAEADVRAREAAEVADRAWGAYAATRSDEALYEAWAQAANEKWNAAKAAERLALEAERKPGGLTPRTDEKALERELNREVLSAAARRRARRKRYAQEAARARAASERAARARRLGWDKRK
ncbi:hypothetical protein [Thiomonas sp.]